MPFTYTNTAGANKERVVLICELCDRRGECSPERFVEYVGAETAMADALVKFAAIKGCERAREQGGRIHDRCQIRREV